MCPVYNSTRNVELEVVWPLLFHVLYIQDIATAVTCRKGMAINVLCPMIYKTLLQL